MIAQLTATPKRTLLTAITLLTLALLSAGVSMASNSSNITQLNNAVYINAGDNIQSIINQHPAGTTFVLRAGVYRMQTIRPRTGDTYIGETGAIMNGSRLLTNFQRDGNLWVATGQKQQGRVFNLPGWQICDEGFGRCVYPEDLFIDNQPLTHVSSRSAVVPGTWYFDYANDRIYFADDPTGRVVETSVTDHAILPYSDFVTLNNIVVEKYANPVQQPAILAYGTRGWTIENVTAQLNHSSGIGLGHSMQIINSRAINNGQIGIAGIGDDVVVYGNEIAYNNWANFNPYWEAGGTKFVRTDRLLLSNNYVHNNYGPGLWTDIDNINVIMENNVIFHNAQHGIFHEISYSAVIRNNIVKFNNTDYFPGVYGSQIQIANSNNTEVYGNEVVTSVLGGNGIGVVNEERGSGEYGTWQSYNVYVHNNTIVYMSGRGFSGVQTFANDRDRFWRESNNRFDYNTYYVGNTDGHYWTWQNRDHTINGMYNYGQEYNGQVLLGMSQGANMVPAWSNALIAYPARPDIELDLEVNRLMLIDADSDQFIGELYDGMTIDLLQLPTSNLNVLAQTKDDVNSVRFYFNGETRSESLAPYALWGDDMNGDYYAWAATPGEYTLRAVPYSETQGTGMPGAEITVNFTVIAGGDNPNNPTPPPPTETPIPTPTEPPMVDFGVTGFTLIDADTDTVIMDVFDGDVINLRDLSTTNLNFSVQTNMDVGSVEINANGMQRLENSAPYAVFGDDNGDYAVWTPELISYTIEAVPYAENDAAGAVGESLSIVISFVDEDDTPTTTPLPPTNTPVPPTATATNTPEPEMTITDLMLVNADTGEALMALQDGATVNLYELPSVNLNIEAMVQGIVSSVAMSMNTTTHIENFAPFALWGDTYWRDGDAGEYAAWTPDAGTYTFRAVPYDQQSGRGAAGQSVSVSVTFVAAPPPTATPLPPTNTPVPPTATATQPPQINHTVDALALINADTGESLMTLQDGMTVNLYDLPTTNLNIEAIVQGAVSSVVMGMNTTTHIENFAPFALWGDTYWRDGDAGEYAAWTPDAGTYNFRAVPYDQQSGRGAAGQSVSVSVTFVDAPPATATPLPPTLSVTGFTLINADSNQPIMAINDGDVIDVATLSTRNLNISAQTSGDVGSVAVSNDGNIRTENGAPYAVFGDSYGDYHRWNPEMRAYVIGAVPYTRRNTRGNAGAGMTITVTFMNSATSTTVVDTQPTNTPVPPTATTVPPTTAPVVIVTTPETIPNVTTFTLINADTNQSMGVMANGMTLDLAALPTRNLNIRADVDIAAGSVNMNLNGGLRQENTAPYALWGDENGDYYSWTPAVGQYTLSATAYTQRDLGGTAGTSLSITFNVVDNTVIISPPEQYTLDVAVSGQGQVVRSVDQPAYESGTVVQLAANPAAGWQFVGWSGAISTQGTTASVTVTDDLRVEAIFVQSQPVAPVVPIVTDPFLAPTQPAPVLTQRRGLIAEYYDNIDFTGPVVVQQESQVQFDWSMSAPVPGWDGDTFSVRWWGWIVPEFTETYTFYTFADDGTRLWINDTLVIDDWSVHSVREVSGTIALQAGQSYRIRLEYFDEGGAAEVSMSWSSPSLPQQIIQVQNLFPVDPGTGVIIEAPLPPPNEPIVSVPGTPATPTPEPPIVVPPPPPAPVDLTMTSICAGQWEIANPNTVAVTFTWMVDGGTARSAPIVIDPGATSLFDTGIAPGTPEIVHIYFDLGDGRGEITITNTTNMGVCP